MKSLSNLSPSLGSNRSTKRLGRGKGTGQGKTAGKGHKGQKARSGGGIRPGFEGGQTPIYMRIPKHGFSNLRTKKVYNIVSVDKLDVFADGTTVDAGLLLAYKLIDKADQPVKLVGKFSLTKKLVVKVAKATKGALASLEAKGGKIDSTGVPTHG